MLRDFVNTEEFIYRPLVKGKTNGIDSIEDLLVPKEEFLRIAKNHLDSQYNTRTQSNESLSLNESSVQKDSYSSGTKHLSYG